MGSYFRRVRFVIVFLVILTIGRFVLGATGVPYEQGTHIFSLVTFSWFASIFFGGFSRSTWGYRLTQAMMLGVAIGLSAQILIWVSTLVSYLVGAQTYFNHPTALNVEVAIPLGEAMIRRTATLVVNTIINSVAALIGWSLGKLVPEKG